MTIPVRSGSLLRRDFLFSFPHPHLVNPLLTTAFLIILLVGLIQAPIGSCWEAEVSAADCPARGFDARGWRSIPRVGQCGQLSGTRKLRIRFGYFPGEVGPIPAINPYFTMPPLLHGKQQTFQQAKTSRQQVLRKRAVRRAIRLLVLRGFVWYRGSRYHLGNFSGLCSQETFDS